MNPWVNEQGEFIVKKMLYYKSGFTYFRPDPAYQPNSPWNLGENKEPQVGSSITGEDQAQVQPYNDNAEFFDDLDINNKLRALSKRISMVF